MTMATRWPTEAANLLVLSLVVVASAEVDVVGGARCLWASPYGDGGPLGGGGGATEDPPCPSAQLSCTLSEAVRRRGDGDVVVAVPGVYPSTESIVTNRSLTIVAGHQCPLTATQVARRAASAAAAATAVVAHRDAAGKVGKHAQLRDTGDTVEASVADESSLAIIDCGGLRREGPALRVSWPASSLSLTGLGFRDCHGGYPNADGMDDPGQGVPNPMPGSAPDANMWDAVPSKAGAVALDAISALTLRHCLFEGNSAGSNAVAAASAGAVALCGPLGGSVVSVTDSVFIGNSFSSTGEETKYITGAGAISVYTNVSVSVPGIMVERCVFTDNSAYASNSRTFGPINSLLSGAITVCYNYGLVGTVHRFADSTFIGNYAESTKNTCTVGGAVVLLTRRHPASNNVFEFLNITVSNNTAISKVSAAFVGCSPGVMLYLYESHYHDNWMRIADSSFTDNFCTLEGWGYGIAASAVAFQQYVSVVPGSYNQTVLVERTLFLRNSVQSTSTYNSAGMGTGALAIYDMTGDDEVRLNATSVVVRGCSFINNYAKMLGNVRSRRYSAGAGVSVQAYLTHQGSGVAHTLAVYDSTFIGNSVEAISAGGGIGAAAGILLYESAEGKGSDASSMLVHNCTIEENVVVAYGGLDDSGAAAVAYFCEGHCQNVFISLEGSRIQSNQAAGMSGGFSAELQSGTANCDFADTLLRGNLGGASGGGGIYIGAGITAVGRRLLIEENIGINRGGGVLTHGTLYLYDSLVAGNTAGFIGGGLSFAHAESTGRLQNVIIFQNTAILAGGVNFDKGRSLEIDNCQFSGNDARSGVSDIWVVQPPDVTGAPPRGTVNISNSLVLVVADEHAKEVTLSLADADVMTSVVYDAELNNTVVCQPGRAFVHRGEEISCEFCPPGQYLLTSSTNVNESTAICRECSFGGDCQYGGARLGVWPTFWGYLGDNDTVQFHVCPPGYCCRQSLSGPCPQFDACTGARSGVMCGTCKQGYSEAFGTTECRLSSTCNDAAWAVPALFVASVLLSIYQQLWRGRPDGASRVVIFFYQVVLLTLGPMTTSSSSSGDLRSFISSSVLQLVQLRLGSITSGDPSTRGLCLYPGMRSVEKHVWHFLPPLLGLGALFLTRGVAKLCCRLRGSDRALSLPALAYKRASSRDSAVRHRSDSDITGDRSAALLEDVQGAGSTDGTSEPHNGVARGDKRLALGRGILRLTLLAFSTVSQATVSLLVCVDIGGKSRLVIDGTVECLASFQWVALALLFLVVVPFPVVLFFWSRRVVNREFSSLNRDSAIATLVAPYRPKRYWWESWAMMRRLLMVVVYSFVHDYLWRQLTMLLLVVTLISANFAGRPFRRTGVQALETLALFCLFLLTALGARRAAAATAGSSLVDTSASVESMVSFVEVVLLLMPLAWYIASQIRDWSVRPAWRMYKRHRARTAASDRF